MTEWIKDKLPPIGSWVLIYWIGSTESGFSIAKMNEENRFIIDHAGCGCCSGKINLYNLKAWVFLPKAPHD